LEFGIWFESRTVREKYEKSRQKKVGAVSPD
jgi:hypothetical protein